MDTRFKSKIIYLILEEKFDEYVNSPEKVIKDIQYAWEKLNETYSFRVVRKQLEDLYLLSKGRLRIGVSQGALASDLEYLNIDKSERSNLYTNG